MIPAANDPCWARVIMSDRDLSQASLGTRLLVGRLRREAKSIPAEIEAKARELYAQVQKNAFMVGDTKFF